MFSKTVKNSHYSDNSYYCEAYQCEVADYTERSKILITLIIPITVKHISVKLLIIQSVQI